MKNVTGFDLPKLVCGACGTLGVLTELTFRVLPAPDQTSTLLLLGLDDTSPERRVARPAAARTMSPGRARARQDRVAPRRRCALGRGAARRSARADGRSRREDGRTATLESRAFWREVRDVAPLNADARRNRLWKISCPPTEGPAMLARIKAPRPAATGLLRLAGGLIWLALPPTPMPTHPIVRGALGRPAARRCCSARAMPCARPSRSSSRSPPRSWRWPRASRKLRSRAALQSGPDGLRCKPTSPWTSLPIRETARSRGILRTCVHCGFCTATCPTYRAAGRRARQSARPHRAHEGDAGEARRAHDAGGRRTHRPLPVLPDLQDDLSVERELHAPGRSRPASHRGDLYAVAGRIASCAGCWPG